MDHEGDATNVNEINPVISSFFQFLKSKIAMSTTSVPKKLCGEIVMVITHDKNVVIILFTQSVL